ncbi:hypothetical protein ABZP36_025749 [Zizania latifolia]
MSGTSCQLVDGLKKSSIVPYAMWRWASVHNMSLMKIPPIQAMTGYTAHQGTEYRIPFSLQQLAQSRTGSGSPWHGIRETEYNPAPAVTMPCAPAAMDAEPEFRESKRQTQVSVSDCQPRCCQ